MENPGLTPLQGPALTAVLHSPCETCPRKIVQPALKICFRLCPQKVPHREFEFLLLVTVQSLSHSSKGCCRIRHSGFQGVEGGGAGSVLEPHPEDVASGPALKSCGGGTCSHWELDLSAG